MSLREEQPTVSTLQSCILADVPVSELIKQDMADGRSQAISSVAHSHRLQPNPSRCPAVSGLDAEVRVIVLKKATSGLAG